MNRLGILVIAAAAAVCASCVRPESSGINDANKRYFDAWMKINHPDAKRDGLGIYILEETTGTGMSAGKAEDYPYAYITYTTTDLEGNISETTDADVAKQIGTFNETATYYGPIIRLRNSTALTAGQEMIIDPMKVGGTRKAVIPGWLNSATYRANTEDGYLNNVTGSDAIMTLTLHDVIKDLTAWQLDSISRYLSHHYPTPIDSLKYGFYYIQTQPPTEDVGFGSGDKVYVNYTGRLLNGRVFDTSIADTAKVAGIYKTSGKEYVPMEVNMDDDYNEITDVVKGMAICLSVMKKGEKGTCIFYSDLGYEGTDKGLIPAFSPLRFDVEMLGTEKK